MLPPVEVFHEVFSKKVLKQLIFFNVIASDRMLCHQMKTSPLSDFVFQV